MRILILGAGGREHALAWKVAQDPRVENVFVAPGNAGTALEAKCDNVAIDVLAIEQLADLAATNVQLTIVGPEAPLVKGVVDLFRSRGLSIFGPTAGAAQLEGSKAFTKDFLARHDIPTAELDESIAWGHRLWGLPREELMKLHKDHNKYGLGFVPSGGTQPGYDTATDTREVYSLTRERFAGEPESARNWAGFSQWPDEKRLPGFKGFVQRYPQHALASNAQYWLGESYYARGDYQNAAVAFAEGYKAYKNSQKGPDNLLKLGVTLNALGAREQACATLAELDRKFPNAGSGVRQGVAREQKRARCGA